ncbi:histidine kinase dimerization/phosphoacceptor domain -containing protein [Blastomonas marina]|uniref:sensor histidine kinase n=1 Tax=Blastomonas marina TaxID=1867408 RepID=UPI002AC98A27|nr:histidine kinase dimerization/phosphoacceptor domain -containing protein [Blastomonas marina]WPZ02614.1 histidine kinase dimerization/phosphoacceptor domain -containing protein [Blastomonas marina]
MQSPDISESREDQRRAAVRRYDILDTPPDGAFDRITALAARRFNVPISVISIVDEDRIWFKSRHGLPVEQIDREPGLCASAIMGDVPYLVEDARTDPRSLANPLVAGEFGLRFYAAVPLTTSDGHSLGTLCVIDKEPRSIDHRKVEDLKDLASIVMDQLELRLSSIQAIERANLLAKEIDHRVKNNLQFVSGLLKMQSRSAGIGDGANHLLSAANRVASVAQVHRHFYSEAEAEVSCADFLRRLCEDLGSLLEREITVVGDEGHVPSNSLQAIGLITNELVTNAAKHGRGKIDVSFRISDSANRLIVCDEGQGPPESFDPYAATAGLGMRVITSLASQLHGTLSAGTRDGGDGACFVVEFPRGP